jgi:hypothetical protein
MSAVRKSAPAGVGHNSDPHDCENCGAGWLNGRVVFEDLLALEPVRLPGLKPPTAFLARCRRESRPAMPSRSRQGDLGRIRRKWAATRRRSQTACLVFANRRSHRSKLAAIPARCAFGYASRVVPLAAIPLIVIALTLTYFPARLSGQVRPRLAAQSRNKWHQGITNPLRVVNPELGRIGFRPGKGARFGVLFRGKYNG